MIVSRLPHVMLSESYYWIIGLDLRVDIIKKVHCWFQESVENVQNWAIDDALYHIQIETQKWKKWKKKKKS